MKFLLLICLAIACASAQQPPAPSSGSDLRYVVVVSRHGVRSPTGKSSQLNQYSSSPWPQWSVPPGNLTAHGYSLMKLFGAYDRSRFVQQGLLNGEGCAAASRATFVADSDQRTRETGHALAEGMFPGCPVEVRARPEGTNDPLFHPLSDKVTDSERNRAVAAIAGRIGGDATNLAAAYRPQLETLDHILAGCGKVPAVNSARTSVLDVPASLSAGTGDHLASLKGPLNIASTLTENLLLEYTEGMSGSDLAWGCMNEPTLHDVLELHAAAEDFGDRTPAIARMLAAPLLRAIGASMEQAATGKPVPDAPGKPTDQVLFLVGHDTNIASISGALRLDWIIDGRRNDTPPGGALLFELWQSRAHGAYSVRLEYTAQTLRQMRELRALTASEPPATVSVFIPACGGADGACPLQAFMDALPGQMAAH